MDITLYGSISTPAIGIVGTWDPFVAEHGALVGSLCDAAHTRGLAAVVFMLDPAPPSHLCGPAKWPVYHDAATRLQLLEATAVDAVACIHFSADDLASGAAEFFDVVATRIELAELWLKYRQSLGSGGRGSVWAIRDACIRRHIKIRYLPRPTHADVGAAARRCLTAGTVQPAAELVGCPPIMHRPGSEQLQLAWHPGRYEAVVLPSPVTNRASLGSVVVDLEPHTNGMTTLRWPDPDAEYLSFVRGPNDQRCH